MIVKPLLIYYGAMALATGLILFLRDGNYRIEMLRERYGRHGLKLKASRDKKINGLDRLYVEEEGGGIFQVFSESIGGDFVFAKETTHLGNNSSTYRLGIVLSEPYESYRNTVIKTDASSLVSICPDLYGYCYKYGCETTLVRAKIETEIAQNQKVIRTIVQPASQQLIDSVMEKMKFDPSIHDKITVNEFPSGFSLDIIRDQQNLEYMEFSTVYRDIKSNLFFSAKLPPIRQVSVIYILLFIFGMYSRYYPEMWAQDIAEGTDNYLAAYDIIEVAHQSFPMFVLQELEFEMYHANFIFST